MVLTVGSIEFLIHLCYNIIMDFGPKNTPFEGDIDIDSIVFTESLAILIQLFLPSPSRVGFHSKTIFSIIERSVVPYIH